MEVLSETLPIDQDDHMSIWALKQYVDKYADKDEDGEPTEVWPDTAYRTVRNVLGALGYTDHDEVFQKLVRLITGRKFIPGGRYLANSGKTLHQVNNCFLYRCEDSREGWFDVIRKAGMALSLGGGVGVVYSDVRPSGTPIRKTNGVATGPLSPAQMLNEVARHIISGGNRRSAIWSGLHWWHADIFDYIRCKDWSDEVKAQKEKDYSFPAPMDMTNISVILDDEFFDAYENSKNPLHEHAHKVYQLALEHMLRSAEPGFSIDVGENKNENLRNAPVCAETRVMTENGYERVGDIVDQSRYVWTGQQYAKDVVFKRTGVDVPVVKVAISGGREIRCDPSHEFIVNRRRNAGKKNRHLDRIERVAAKDLIQGDDLHISLPLVNHNINQLNAEFYTLGFIYGDGSFAKNSARAEITFCTEESKACAPIIAGSEYSPTMNWDDSRGFIRAYFKTDVDKFNGRKKYTFPEEMYYETPDAIASFIAGLWDTDGNFISSSNTVRLSSSSPQFLRCVGRLLEQLGILSNVTKNGHSTYGDKQEWQLVVLADYTLKFADLIPTQRIKISTALDYEAYRPSAIRVLGVADDGLADVFCTDVQVPEHTFMAEGVIISNCSELTSEDDSDVCNLASINLSRIDTLEEFKEIVDLATLFLLAGTVYSDIPHEEVYKTREKNRRLGLGLMGVHEWLLKRDYPYEVTDEFHEWLSVYEESTYFAHQWADQHNLSRPVKTRAIAPNGTISILAETTSGIEPIFCVAEKRRFLTADGWRHQYVINPTANRLIQNEGVDPEDIEDAYSLAYNYEKRIAFQADMQHYVDHAISSTINLPYPITDPEEVKQFGETLFKYLPRLRGITCYPDGARAGQPLTAVPYEVAKSKIGVTYDEREDTCIGGVCGV